MSGQTFINDTTTYYARSTVQDQLDQLEQVAAIAPFIQQADHVCTFDTGLTGPSSNHNLLVNTPVVINRVTGDISQVNSVRFIGSTGTTGLYDTSGVLFYNGVALGTGATGEGGQTGADGASGPTGASGVGVVITAVDNTYVGDGAGSSNSLNNETAFGKDALQIASAGSGFNVAVGDSAMVGVTSASNTISIGSGVYTQPVSSLAQMITIGTNSGNALDIAQNSIIIGNSALGAVSGPGAVGFSDNIFIGYASGYSVPLGDGVENIIAIGSNSGNTITNNTRCIYLDSVGSAGETGSIRIGDAGDYTYNIQDGIRGITTDNADAIPVVIDSAGQLGTVSSSIKYKENVEDLDNSELIYKLRPVKFNNKKHPNTISVGLIAEEVLKVYPEMCIYQNGELLTVDYQRLNILMLAEIQKLKNEINILKRVI